MTDTAHTPAPWLVGEDQCVDECWSIVTTSGGAIIANVNDQAARQANARLIAAAPNMLAALKVAQLWLDVDGRFDMQGINAAIAKAEGRS